MAFGPSRSEIAVVSKPTPEEFQTTIRLVAAAQGGSATAFEDLFQRYHAIP